MTAIEEEVILLKAVKELIDSMVNFERNRSADFVIWRSCQPLRFLEYVHGSILLSWMSAA